jgi:hypothetical protein
MTRVFKSLKSTILIFGQVHQLTSCWTDEYKALAHLEFEYEISPAICKHSVEIGKSKCETQKQTHWISKCVPPQHFSLLRHTRFTRYINDLPFHLFSVMYYKLSYWFYVLY